MAGVILSAEPGENSVIGTPPPPKGSCKQSTILAVSGMKFQRTSPKTS